MTSSKNKAVIILTCSSVFVAQLGMMMYLPALPTISQEMGASADLMTLALSAYLVGMSLPMLFWGIWGARFGRKLALSAAFIIYAASSLLLTHSETAGYFIFLRVIQGIGSSGISVMARTLISDHFEGDRLAESLSYLSISFVISLGVGQYLGSLLQDAFGWRSIFYTLSAAALLLIAATGYLQIFKAPPKSQANPDWRSYWILLSKPVFLRPALAGGLGYGVLIAFNTCGPFIFQKYYGWTSSEYGLLGWPISATYFIGALIVNRLVSRTGRLLLMSLGMRLMLCGCGMMVLGGIVAPALPLMIWLPYCLIVLGQAMNYPISLSMATDSSPASRPYAIALSGFMHQLIAAAIGGIASLISSQSSWHLSIMCLLLTAGAYLCLAFPGSKAALHKR